MNLSVLGFFVLSFLSDSGCTQTTELLHWDFAGEF